MRYFLLLSIGLFYFINGSNAACFTDSTSDFTDGSSAQIKLYRVNRSIVESVIGAGLFSDYFAISRIKNKPTISDAEISTLNTAIINPIDRWALNQNAAHRNEFENLSNYGQIPIFLLPGLLAFNKDISHDWLDLFLMYVEGHTITFTFYNYSFLGPTFQNKYRPYTYYTQVPLDQREQGNNRNSFYSGHVASCTYATFFMAKIYCDYHPDLGAGKYQTYVIATIPPLVIADFRIRAMDHFPSDCAVGYLLGGAIGIAIPALHQLQSESLSISMVSIPQGAGLGVCWTLDNKHHFIARDKKKLSHNYI